VWPTSSAANPYENFIYSIYDWYKFFATTPCSIHETFGNFLGDMSPVDWQESFQCVYNTLFTVCIVRDVVEGSELKAMLVRQLCRGYL
jgi:hypothetical protein